MGGQDWVPLDFLLGKQYSGYCQAINASRDLKVHADISTPARRAAQLVAPKGWLTLTFRERIL